jgi:hypothetical protein
MKRESAAVEVVVGGEGALVETLVLGIMDCRQLTFLNQPPTTMRACLKALSPQSTIELARLVYAYQERCQWWRNAGGDRLTRRYMLATDASLQKPVHGIMAGCQFQEDDVEAEVQHSRWGGKRGGRGLLLFSRTLFFLIQWTWSDVESRSASLRWAS